MSGSSSLCGKIAYGEGKKAKVIFSQKFEGDSVSSLKKSVSKIVAGSKILTLYSQDANHSVATIPAEDLKTMIGTTWKMEMVMVCSNGDTAAQNNIYSIACAWNDTSKQMNIMCYTSIVSSGHFRLNYICYLNK